MQGRVRFKGMLWIILLITLITSGGVGYYLWQTYEYTKYHTVSNATEL